jgi:glycosyltransferase involved in cell wall biosynthesis
MIDNQPLVSVIMNAHNGEKYLSEAISSVLSQNYKNLEIIFWDNCSTDKTSELIKSFNDSRLLYFLSDRFTPLGEARNLAIKKSKGEFIAFLDCDDLWLQEKISEQLVFFTDPSVGLVYSDVVHFNNVGDEKIFSNMAQFYSGNVFSELLKNNFISMPSVIIRREIFSVLEHWFDNSFTMCEEYDLFIRIAHDWNVQYDKKVLAKWRVHSDSWTHDKTEDFSKERIDMLGKYKQLFPCFEEKYKKEIHLINRANSYELAKIEWKLGCRRKARLLLKSFMNDGLRWRATVYAMYFPYELFEMLLKRKRILPSK